MIEPAEIPRFVPGRDFPPYSFVPGLFPHPISDSRGHGFGQTHPTPLPLNPDEWHSNADYLFGIDLFNHGYYWEAHETWEGLWHACGRTGLAGDFLKGLIQLAAAGVKVRQGMPPGVASLGKGAANLFDRVRAEKVRFLGIDVEALSRFANELAEHPQCAPTSGATPVERVLSLVLRPE